jgi:hypothetical protein
MAIKRYGRRTIVGELFVFVAVTIFPRLSHFIKAPNQDWALLVNLCSP